MNRNDSLESFLLNLVLGWFWRGGGFPPSEESIDCEESIFAASLSNQRLQTAFLGSRYLPWVLYLFCVLLFMEFATGQG